MPVTIPWHSVKETVHHNNTNCSAGTTMDPDYRRGGTGGKRLCDECKKLNDEGK